MWALEARGVMVSEEDKAEMMAFCGDALYAGIGAVEERDGERWYRSLFFEQARLASVAMQEMPKFDRTRKHLRKMYEGSTYVTVPKGGFKLGPKDLSYPAEMLFEDCYDEKMSKVNSMFDKKRLWKALEECKELEAEMDRPGCGFSSMEEYEAHFQKWDKIEKERAAHAPVDGPEFLNKTYETYEEFRGAMAKKKNTNRVKTGILDAVAIRLDSQMAEARNVMAKTRDMQQPITFKGPHTKKWIKQSE